MFPDFFGSPTAVNGDVQVFNAGPTWQTWNRPRGCTMAYMTCIGAGSGGGGGMTGAVATIRGGGGGGGSGGISRLLIPLMFVPDRLFIGVGKGGNGGNAMTIGGTGSASYINAAAATTAASGYLYSSNANPGGGVAGSVAGNAAGGAAATVGTATGGCVMSQFGIAAFLAGKAGAAGGVVGGSAGTANVLLSASQLSGGAGGGTTPAANTEFAGGAQTGAGLYPTLAGGAAGGNPGHGNGAPNYNNPWVSYGGSGGGTGGAAATVGGNGGGGGIGSGGGGGGGGVTGGRGGKGGDGLVTIVCW